MRFLTRQSGWPSSCPLRADGQRESAAWRAEAEHTWSGMMRETGPRTVLQNHGAQSDKEAAVS